MSSKFEQLLDYLVNEEHEKANELFHEIVVEKSRDIYENLIAEEEEEDKMEEASEEDDEAMEEASEDDEDAMEESTEEDDEAMEETYEEEAVESIFGEAGDEEFPVQDKTDDAEDDVAAPEMDGDMDSEGDSDAPADKGDIQDLEDALEELKAEFEALMAAEKNEEENEPGVHDDEDGDSPLDSVDDEEGEEEEEKGANPFAESKIARTQGEKMREYIEKVSATMVDGEGVGSGRGDLAGQTGHDSGKSPISSGSGKPQSGANAKNIAQSGKGANEDGTSPKGKVGGLVKTGGDFVKAGTKNVASSANAKKPDGSKLSSVSKPGNKEGAPVGSGTGDKAGQTGAVDTNSPLNGAPNRAK
jgi:hypothetical protein